MLTSKDIDRVLVDYRPLFRKYGFARSRQNTYVNANNVRLQFIVDKWGWTEDRGIGFVVRLFDLSKAVGEYKLIHPDDTLDMPLHYLIDKGVVSEDTINMLYAAQPPGVRQVADDGYWLAVFDEEGLRQLLDRFIERMLAHARAWRS